MTTPQDTTDLGAGSPEQDRYLRQELFRELGGDGQRRLREGRVLLVGCGGLGSAMAELLVRAGVGFLRIVDRDYVELGNLHRQSLFTERDAAVCLPKAIAAAEHLAEINSGVVVEPVVEDVCWSNVERLLQSVCLILDGTDNFETRYLINDAAVKYAVPWVYGACVAATGMVWTIVPGQTPCLRCVWEQPPPPGTCPTCETLGVLPPAVHLVAALQAMAAMQVLARRTDAVRSGLLEVDLWSGGWRRVDVGRAAEDCPCCQGRKFEFLDSASGNPPVVLCGRDMVQVCGQGEETVDFADLAERLVPLAKNRPVFNRYLMRFAVDRYEVTLFRDGRALIRGASRPEEARSVYARYIGH